MFYTAKKNAVRAARKAVGRNAVEDKDFTVRQSKRGWSWTEVRPDLSDKQTVVFDLLSAPGGVTQAQVREALGWKECYVFIRAVAAKVGRELAITKEPGQPKRYRLAA